MEWKEARSESSSPTKDANVLLPFNPLLNAGFGLP